LTFYRDIELLGYIKYQTSTAAYEVYISQVICWSRDITQYNVVLVRAQLLTLKLT